MYFSGSNTSHGHQHGSSQSGLPPSNPQHSSSPPFDDIQIVITALKRKVETLEEENKQLKGTKSTKPKITRTFGMVIFLFKSASSVGKEVVDNEIINQSSDEENINLCPPPSALSRSGKCCKSTKKTVSQIWNISAVSPRMIAYAATLLCFILSDGPSWGADDSFPYESFYNGIIDFFEDVEAGSEDETRNRQ
ncbi:hypothetical protein F5050DRAFT_1813589 [Lentinula boryana]|uniref:Uncharacterized protein n=1 Tax=Lentinula boryana TaxID=40481 RepID=A0ABQ8PWB7_9AGAR|nr:hypothetical protein F5050DRAFT_1813589 [Lentinula boryana]